MKAFSGIETLLFVTFLMGVQLVLFSCAEPPRAVTRDTILYGFDPIELSDASIWRYSLRQMVDTHERVSIRQNMEEISIQEESLLRFAVSLLASKNLNSPHLQQIIYRSPCDYLINPEHIAYLFVLPSTEAPAFPYIMASVRMSIVDASVEFNSYHVQAGWAELSHPTFTFPTPISYRNALMIAEEHGSGDAVQQLGSQCEFEAVLRSKLWEIDWYHKQLPIERGIFNIAIDATTGEVVSSKWADEVK